MEIKGMEHCCTRPAQVEVRPPVRCSLWSTRSTGMENRGTDHMEHFPSFGSIGLPAAMKPMEHGQEHWSPERSEHCLHSAGAGGGKAHRCDVADVLHSLDLHSSVPFRAP